jgi:uncharacterized protein
VVSGKEAERVRNSSDYFDYAEPLMQIPSHPALALFRGRREQVLMVSLRLDAEEEKPALESPWHKSLRARIASAIQHQK